MLLWTLNCTDEDETVFSGLRNWRYKPLTREIHDELNRYFSNIHGVFSNYLPDFMCDGEEYNYGLDDYPDYQLPNVKWKLINFIIEDDDEFEETNIKSSNILYY